MTTRRAKRDTRWKITKFALFLCTFILVFALVWLRTTVVKLEYELSQLGKQRMELVREEKLVSAEKASFYSIGKIEDVAIKKLGMSLPERDKVFFVKRTTGPAPYRVSIKSLPPGD